MGGNFDYLAQVDPQLARLGKLAEHYFHDDPPTSIGKTRQLAELFAKQVAARGNLDLQPRAAFEEVFRLLREGGLLPREVAELFHYLRRTGNAAIHENSGTLGDALTSLKAARQIGIWFWRTFLGAPAFSPGPFKPPRPPVDAAVQLRAEIEQLRETVRTHESAAECARREAEEATRARETAEERARREANDREAAEQLLEEVEASRRQVEETLAELRQAATHVSTADLLHLQTAAEAASSAVELDEADTRRLIDAKLRLAGWVADSDAIRRASGSRPDDADAIAIAEWPTETGPVDYALFLKGRCVGVAEAKRVSTDVPAVLDQAERYAEGIKLDPAEVYPGGPYQHGLNKPFRVPFVFATNGRPFVKQLATKSGIWVWDARRATNMRSALPEWFSPQDIEERLQQDAHAAEDLAAETFSYAGLRPYQQEAVRAVEAAIEAGQRDILVAMATGTGKTRTSIVLMYRLLKHKRFRTSCSWSTGTLSASRPCRPSTTPSLKGY
jgi:type I restriction enzyme R subunit